MKTVRLLFGIVLGIGLTLLYQWMVPPKVDPYYFLSPKPLYLDDKVHSIEKPIKLYQKGESFDFAFWSVPQPEPKLLYLFPASYPSPQILLKVKNINFSGGTSAIIDKFEANKIINNIPIIDFKLYRINNDLTETLVHERNINKLEMYHVRDGSVFFGLSDQMSEYGQYRIHIDVLNDNEKLNTDELSYSIFVGLRFYK